MYKGFVVAESAINESYSFMLFDKNMQLVTQLPEQLKDDNCLENKGSHIDFVGDLAYVDYFNYEGYLLPFEPFDSFSYSNWFKREYMPTGAPMLHKMPPNIVCTPTDCGLPASDSLSTPAAISG